MSPKRNKLRIYPKSTDYISKQWMGQRTDLSVFRVLADTVVLAPSVTCRVLLNYSMLQSPS